MYAGFTGGNHLCGGHARGRCFKHHICELKPQLPRFGIIALRDDQDDASIAFDDNGYIESVKNKISQNDHLLSSMTLESEFSTRPSKAE